MTKNVPAWRVDNLYPIVISFITMILAVSALYWGLAGKIDLLTQEVRNNFEITRTNRTSIQQLQTLYAHLQVGVAQCCPEYSQ